MQTTPAQPTVALVGGGVRPELLASHPLLARSFYLITHPGEDGAARFLLARRPELILCNLLLPKAAFAALAELLSGAEFPCSTVLFAPKPRSARLEALAGAVPGAPRLYGRHRLLPRLVEAIAVASGASLRVRARAELHLPLELQLQGGAVAARLMDLSESGARVATSRVLDIGELLTLRFQEEGGLTVRGRVVRTDATPLGPTAGITFEPLEDGERALFARLQARIDEGTEPRGQLDPVRGSLRQQLPQGAARLTLTPRGGAARNGLTVRDLSEGGLGAVGPSRALAGLSAGTPVDCVLEGDGEQLALAAEVVHLLPQPLERSLIGLRFYDLSAATRTRLAALTVRWRTATGSRAASRTRR